MPTSPIQRNVTQVLRTLLLAHGEDQSDVAKALRVTQAAVSNKMAGKTRWSLDDVEALAEHFGMEDPGLFLNDPRALLSGIGFSKSGPRGRRNYDGDVGTMSQKYEFDDSMAPAA